MRERKPLERNAALVRMADLCARSEQCEAEILQKLLRLGLGHADAEGVVAELVERRFIDDARYAAAFARDKVRFAGWGRLKIRAALAAKRIPSATVNEAIAAVEAADYDDALMRAARAKARSLDLDDPADRNRLLRHIASRGFEPSKACEALAMLKSDLSEL